MSTATEDDGIAEDNGIRPSESSREESPASDMCVWSVVPAQTLELVSETM